MSKPQFKVSVHAQALPEQTDAERGVYAFSYALTIENTGDITTQLVARHWQITDTQGTVQQVDGLAVIGHQPLLTPGQKFQYTSWVQIATPQGSMSGRFLCVSEAAEVFYADVPEFLLADTSTLH